MEIYHGKRLTIEKKEITLPNGKRTERVVVHPGGAVAILPVIGDDCYLIRQYRFAIDDYIFEAPAGTIDEGEEPQETAYRELIEETGMKAETFVPKGWIYPSPGYTDERIWLYLAEGLSPCSDYSMDDDEVIEVVRVPVRDLAVMIADGRIVDAKTICLACRCVQ
ncbi:MULTISPECIES: NUDIX hydrolase [unclassified Methanoculleus]|uniref:NUDIX hydrolase n=1 Tax=unclassified Methanoculleus TaxID=2619537 RepID=UPI0025D90E2F|nr:MULTISPECIES: NUDIX hydrolase [unclassified Methanoculleus]MCK9318030.1 NUDIX hydrolase [Methanoculleus sp.]MDD2253238.1 NUDIX hydrolase [Methanoculleus sp.]MDD2786559.1 NUDIX hydrolase [Methanoculleus sp.]MDD3215524.1 NUDIX hydrolase [Methanoculleus sp.]MDD4313202.1 NUDIX hydrolase [Methanoculleus sp.]